QVRRHAGQAPPRRQDQAPFGQRAGPALDARGDRAGNRRLAGLPHPGVPADRGPAALPVPASLAPRAGARSHPRLRKPGRARFRSRLLQPQSFLGGVQAYLRGLALRDRGWTLAEIAREIGGSPVYLTQVFRQIEGLPLYRYQLHLRLARALDLIPGCESLAALAFDLGFSSHSHFSAAFKRTYGVSPS